ncbi:OprO/OprP family phosphate-selective porin [Pseudoxanthomonas wuyuanensis]|uniref:Phosphate-selective porin OprO and OprP n=1 Tax=Pseudoxanthomonas wuyuanensis TaxID=1073196 RepID=A0A286D048_9GAMM|nr:porin [Pseudoxanthomonas wuyuanensis]KAF1716104.1 porin [Pseudoxanthomonas wuyuanensis]SOD52040.1 phosphate-selective porin OprO and OprP [Pseudoxanthomonas wuyuanensis]
MKPVSALTLALLALPACAAAQDAGSAAAHGSIWPPKYTFGNGTELAATGNFGYDFNAFSGNGYGNAALDDDHDWRRREFGLTLKRKGVYDFVAVFDFQPKTWSDVALRLESKALLGRDAGRFRIGQMKLPLGFEGNTSTRNGSLMENSLPTQAFYQGRRIGVDWAFERPRYLLNAGYYGQDLQGNNNGSTAAARAAWIPFNAAGQVLHLGVSASEERPESEINGLGVRVLPSVRWRAKPEASLTAVRLVDSGTLTQVDRIRRSGLEALWIRGPYSLQGEYLRQRTQRDAGLPSYSADGFYLFGSWLLTGGSRPYSGGNVGNPKPAGKHGALELLARYSSIDLDSDGIAGGRQRNWTLGANWYLHQNFKFQANYVRVDAERGQASADPHAFELRGQFSF